MTYNRNPSAFPLWALGPPAEVCPTSARCPEWNGIRPFSLASLESSASGIEGVLMGANGTLTI